MSLLLNQAKLFKLFSQLLVSYSFLVAEFFKSLLVAVLESHYRVLSLPNLQLGTGWLPCLIPSFSDLL